MPLFEGLHRRRAVVTAVALCAVVALAATPVLAQSEASAIEELRQEVERLRTELEQMRAEKESAAEVEEVGVEMAEPAEAGADAMADRLDELERQIGILAEEMEREQLGEAAATADRSDYGYGPAASKIYRTGQGLSVGGYGEMLYERFDSTRDDGADSGETDQLDFLRAIVYFGYKFNDNWLFNSEVEFEHGSVEEGGDVSVEFAYLDYLWKPELNLSLIHI